jgi:hypothetical protein
MNEVSQSIAVTEDQVKRAHNFKDLTGQRFGRLLVIDLAEKTKPKQVFWNCLCDCGKPKVVRAMCLTRGMTKSCGCYNLECIRGRHVSLAGERFGRLVAKSKCDHIGGNRIRYLCECDCGKTKEVDVKSLKNGMTRSCGCLRSETTSARVRTHGQSGINSKTPTYQSWCDMHKRTSNPNSADWHNYGARGIKVCEEWDSFERFFADMGEKPLRLTLDRIDNNKGYSKDNCRWATKSQQRNNCRDSVKVEFRGEIMNLNELSDLLGIKRTKVSYWYYSKNADFETLASLPR